MVTDYEFEHNPDGLDRDYERKVLDKLVPQIEKSNIVMTLYTGSIDAKIALETGVAVLLEKPILLVIAKGVEIPSHLLRIVSGIVTYDPERGLPSYTEEIQAAAEQIFEHLPKEK